MKEKLLSLFSRDGNRKKIKKFYTKESDFALVIIPLLWMFLFFILPLVIVLKISLSSSVFGIPPFSEVFSSLSAYSIKICLNFKNYFMIFKNSYYISAFINSIILASITVVICLFLGFSMAYGISNIGRRKTKTLLLLLVSLSFWTSFLIRIYAWMNLFSFHGIVNSMLLKLHIIDSPIRFIGNYYAVCLGMVFCYIPFMIFPIYSVLEKVDNSLLEASSDLGCHPMKAFWKVNVPLSMTGIASGCLLVFATSVGEFVIPELLGGASTITLGRVLWIEFFNNLNWPMACALSIIVMIFIIFPVFIIQRKSED